MLNHQPKNTSNHQRKIGAALANYRYLAGLLISLLCSSCIPTHHAVSSTEFSSQRLHIEAEKAAQQCRQNIKVLDIPLQSFTTDGCSFWPDEPWLQCCIEHDIAYWCGGTATQRRQADAALMQCVEALDYPLTSWLMGLGVRIGGHPWLPLPWRWGYGREWPRSYEEP
jgi:hypothetical protein